MKLWLVHLLRKTGLYRISATIFHSLRNIRHFNPIHEVKIKIFGAPDKLPLPPASLVFAVIGHGWRSVYFDSGRLISANILKNLKKGGVDLKDLKNILDFGCGCGRLIRHFHQSPVSSLQGTDYNHELVQWCQANLPFASFSTNQLAPPLAFSAETFNLIYAQSIFTHLSEALQLNWLKEFHRILKPGGIFYFTTHGDQFIHSLKQREKDLYHEGKIVVRNLDKEGKNICATYQKPLYFQQQIKNGFEMLPSLPGLSTPHLRQDVNIFRKTGAELQFN